MRNSHSVDAIDRLLRARLREIEGAKAYGNASRDPLHLALQEAAAYAGLPAPFLLRLVAERKLACWKTEGPSESGEGYFFARAELEALRPSVEDAG